MGKGQQIYYRGNAICICVRNRFYTATTKTPVIFTYCVQDFSPFLVCCAILKCLNPLSSLFYDFFGISLVQCIRTSLDLLFMHVHEVCPMLFQKKVKMNTFVASVNHLIKICLFNEPIIVHIHKR